MHSLFNRIIAMLALFPSIAAAGDRPIVVELFTSQGCSSCPPADEMLRELSANPGILPLSLHVHYWDYLGWKDPFSSEANTERQRAYAHELGLSSVFTPQVVVDGSYSAVGSNRFQVEDAISSARRRQEAVPVSLTPDSGANMLNVEIGKAQGRTPNAASVYEVRFRRNASTDVNAGENSGSTLSSVNNVTEMTRLGGWRNQVSTYRIPLNTSPEEGVAVFVQADAQGAILGAATH